MRFRHFDGALDCKFSDDLFSGLGKLTEKVNEQMMEILREYTKIGVFSIDENDLDTWYICGSNFHSALILQGIYIHPDKLGVLTVVADEDFYYQWTTYGTLVRSPKSVPINIVNVFVNVTEEDRLYVRENLLCTEYKKRVRELL